MYDCACWLVGRFPSSTSTSWDKAPGVGMITSRMMGTFLEDQRSRKEVLSLMGYG